jgi:hypothetical protein
MANSYNSKEIIKIIPNDKRTEGQSPARIVRGLYVTGVWRPPHYIDRTLIVDAISSSHVRVRNFTTATKHVLPGDMCFGSVDIRSSKPVVITRYSAKNVHITPGDMCFGCSDIRVSKQLIVKKWITKNVHVTPGDMCFGCLDASSSKMVILLKLPINSRDIPPGQPSLQITKVTSDHVAVTSTN